MPKQHLPKQHDYRAFEKNLASSKGHEDPVKNSLAELARQKLYFLSGTSEARHT